MSAFTTEMEKWFHPHIVARLEAEFARLEARIRSLEVAAGLIQQTPAPVPPSAPTEGPSA